MAEYYFVSQLPSLDAVNENMPLPITEERFFELCKRFLGKKAFSEYEQLKLFPSRDFDISSSRLINAWNEGERNLRLALGKVRAERLKKSFDTENNILPAQLLKAAQTAAETENPMEAEKFLNNYRLDFLETLRPMDTFSEDFVFYYAIKLKLILHIRQFDTEIGKAVYKDIYNSIINGERLEAIQ